MPAPKQVSDKAVKAAVDEWRGNVAHAAAALGIWPANLRKRIKALGIDLAAARSKGVTRSATPLTPLDPNDSRRSASVQTAPMVLKTPMGSLAPMGRTAAARANSSGGFFSGANRRPTLSHMQAAAAKEIGEDAAPIKTSPRRQQPLRLRPDLREQLERGAWQLQAKYQVPTDDNLILEQYVEEGFQQWLADKMKGPTAPPATNGKKKASDR